MLARIIGALGRAELLEAFYAAARAVENPRKWAIYEDIARQVAARGEIPHAPPGRAAVKAERAAEFEREMRAKYGDKLKRMREQKNGKPENGR
jgi:hypothetical protein